MIEYLEIAETGVPIFVKLGLTAGLFLYIVFALVIVKQVSHMTSTLEMGFETPIRLLAWAHLLFSVGTLALALVIL